MVPARMILGSLEQFIISTCLQVLSDDAVSAGKLKQWFREPGIRQQKI